MSGSLCAVLLSTLLAGSGQDWPDFRGPRCDGHAGEPGLPLRFGDEENLRWKVAIPGRGWSSPVVGGQSIWMTTARDEGRRLHAVAVHRESGEILHDVHLLDVAEPRPIHAFNSHASPSPVLNGDRVFVHFGTYLTACLDRITGKVLWRRTDIHCDHIVGPGSSPFVCGDLLFLHMDGGDEQYVIALDTVTGETAWRSDRSTDFGKLTPDQRKAYGTPIVIEVAGAPQLISAGAEAAFGYDPDTGDELWRVRYRGYSMSSRPVAGGGLVFLNTGFDKPSLLAVRVDGRGDVTDSHVAWRTQRNVPTMASPLLIGDLLFLVDDGGIATCHEAASGTRLWRERIGGQYSASPVYADGRIYFFSREGRVPVLAPDRSYQLLAVNQLGDGFMASPAVSGRALILRSKTHLFRIEQPLRTGGGELPPPR